MRVVADRERCVGSGMCVLSEETVFDQSPGDGRVRVLIESPDPATADSVRYAVDWCPARALALVED